MTSKLSDLTICFNSGLSVDFKYLVDPDNKLPELLSDGNDVLMLMDEYNRTWYIPIRSIMYIRTPTEETQNDRQNRQ